MCNAGCFTVNRTEELEYIYGGVQFLHLQVLWQARAKKHQDLLVSEAEQVMIMWIHAHAEIFKFTGVKSKSSAWRDINQAAESTQSGGLTRSRGKGKEKEMATGRRNSQQ